MKTPAIRTAVCVVLVCLGLRAPSAVASDAGADPENRVENVVVTGSRLQPVAEQSAQDIRSYDRDRIERSGQTTVADFLATVPEVSLNSVESSFIATSVRLRGAREGSTLILINGRRTQAVTGDAASFGFFDLNTIPLAMVDHIEVLPNTSSAIYGGEALAGVVNIVLREDFEGLQVSAGYKSADDTHEQLFSSGWGWQGESSRVSIIANYNERDPLSGSQRAITASSDFRGVGGPNLGSAFFGSPTTIQSVAGNLPGLNSNIAAVPAGSSGVGLSPADFIATAGRQNTGSFNRYQELVPRSVSRGVFASAEYRFESGIELFAEVLASDFRKELATSPPTLLQALVPATNAFNPFGVAVRASGVVSGAEDLARLTLTDELVRPLVGVRGSLGKWAWETTVLYSQDRGEQRSDGQPIAALLTAALASADPRTALNPFVDGPMASPEVLAAIFGQTNLTRFRGDATVLNAFVRGSPWSLPAGAVETVVGAEYEKSGLERGTELDRNARAVFTELRVPLLDAQASQRELLAVRGALRYDDYNDFGSETTWQAGLEYRPFESVLLRANHGTGFKPPTLFNLGAPATRSSVPIVDPLRNGESAVIQSISGGNPDLDPTTAESSMVGIVWSPAGVEGLNLSLSGWRLRIDDGINLPNAQFIVDNESRFPGRVMRAVAPAGSVAPIIAVDRRNLNFGTIREAGIDASIDGGLQTTRAGKFTAELAASYMTKFEGASAPGAPDVNRLSRANSDGIFAPRLKANVGAGWQPDGTVRASLSGRYIGSYFDYTPTRKLGDVWYLDGALEFGVGQLLSARDWPRTLKMFVTGTNLTDKMPPYSTYFRGYDVFNYDLVGRTVFVKLQLEL